MFDFLTVVSLELVNHRVTVVVKSGRFRASGADSCRLVRQLHASLTPE